MATARVEPSAGDREAMARLLDAANGNRRARRLTSADVEATIEAALQSPVGYAWHSAGDSPDARSLTAICLAVKLDDEVVVSASSARGAATPASAWHDIPAWNVVHDGANALVARAWARRRDDARLRFPLRRAEPETNEASLVAQILAAPEDDVPRRVLSDLLGENGDPRGEFIALQLELARRHDEAIAARADELLKAHGAEWAGVSRRDAAVTFRRGFVESVQVFDAAVSAGVSALCEREPVTALRFLSGRRFEMHSLALASWLPRVRVLEFVAPDRYGNSAITAAQLSTLLASPSLRRLERLVLREQRIGDAGAAALASHAASLPRLTSLVLDGAELTARGVRALSGIRWLNRLDELSLADSAFQVQGVETLVGDGAGRRWSSLNLSGTAMGNAGAFVLSRARRLAGVESLWLARNRIGPAGLNALLDAAHFRSLKDVELSGNPIGAAGRGRLAERFGHAPHRVG